MELFTERRLPLTRSPGMRWLDRPLDPNDPSRSVRRTAMLVGGIILAALVIATITSAQLYLNWRLYGEIRPYEAIWLAEAAEWLLWAFAIPVVVALDRRFGFAAGRRRLAPLLHLGLFAAWYGAVNLVMTRFAYDVADPVAAGRGFWHHFVLRAVNHVPSALLTYGAILGAWLSVRAAAARSRRTATLEARLAETRLQFLRAQIRPHFLFNTLHTIGGLVREGDRDAAVDAIGRLSDLLRRALSTTDRGVVALSEELEFLDSFFEIQRLRFGDRVTLVSRIEPNVEDAAVPSMLLQPLVENAIRHGLDPRGGRGKIEVRAAREHGRLVLTVVDDGVGLSAGGPTGPRYVGKGEGVRDGIGLENLRQRLGALFGTGTSVTVQSENSRGTRVRIELPFHRTREPLGV